MQAWRSAGCATGEEAFTLAILLGRELGCHNVRVLGTDISETALKTAHAATYPSSAVAAVPSSLRRWAFDTDDREDQVKIKPSVARTVEFKSHNLAEDRFRVDLI